MDAEPLVSVVRGTPTDAELAALTAVLVSRSTAADARPRPPALSAWSRSARPTTIPVSWRASGQPTR